MKPLPSPPMVRIAVLDDYQGAASGCADWGSLHSQVEFFSDHLTDHRALVERLAGFEVVVAMRERTPFRRELLTELPDLRLLVTTGMRNAAIDVGAATELGITVCGTPSPGHATAELTFALILALSRGLIDQVSSMRSGGWQAKIGRDVRGTTLGLIGLGRLGSQVAGFARAFSMDVISWSENLTDERAAEVGVRRVDRDTLFSASDIVSIHLRLSDRSRGLIGADELAAMKPTAYLINTSRGPIVDTDALLAAVRSGSIAGAAVDVYETEPAPADHPFRTEPRILATPHIGYVTEQTYRIFYEAVVEDIAGWLAGTPVRVLT
jgi:phosphoglycerate dehydrogenase-like enzyme